MFDWIRETTDFIHAMFDSAPSNRQMKSSQLRSRVFLLSEKYELSHVSNIEL